MFAFDKAGIIHFFNAARYSAQGLKHAWSHLSFKQEIALFAVLLPLPIVAHCTSIEKIILYGCMFLVLICEMLHVALQTLLQLAKTTGHPLVAKATDLSSAAVSLTLINLFGCWIMILLPQLSLRFAA